MFRQVPGLRMDVVGATEVVEEEVRLLSVLGKKIPQTKGEFHWRKQSFVSDCTKFL